MSQVIKTLVIPSNPADQEKILAAVVEADNALILADGHKDHVKAIVENLLEEYPDLTKKYINKMINTYHKQNMTKISEEMTEFEELYFTIVK